MVNTTASILILIRSAIVSAIPVSSNASVSHGNSIASGNSGCYPFSLFMLWCTHVDVVPTVTVVLMELIVNVLMGTFMF
ncbi:hypothetical protein N7467_001674 [Penicillium canescens]|nr:hypothetical protein N7467_001674 [Penicillium canescens]